MKPKYRPAVFIVVYARNKGKIEYLILKRKLHWTGWEFPKGGLENGEESSAAVKREVFEETGLKTRKIQTFNFSGRYKYKKQISGRSFIGQEFVLYAAEVEKSQEKKIILDKREHSDYRWLRYNDALKKLTFPNQKKALEIVNNRLTNKFREYITSSKKVILCGKDAKSNEKLVNEFKGKNNTILHTALPGSPFCVIAEKASEKDIKEAAIFCARYSQDWRNNKNNAIVHIFSGKDVYKRKGMKLGTFGVRKRKEIKINKRDILKLENVTSKNC